MKFHSKVAALLALIACCFVSGCSKKSDSGKDSGAPQTIDAGTVELTMDKPVHQNLAGGKVLVLTASPLTAQSFSLTADLQNAGQKFPPQSMMTAISDKVATFNFGNITIQVTPHITQ